MSRRYSKEFKASAVQLCEDRGWRMADVARELGVDYDTLYRWVTEARGRVPARDHGDETKDQELARLRRENKRLETELEFAKKAAAFFAKQPR